MKKRAHITLVNELETSAIDIADRGLAYGDGLFETIRIAKGEAPLLDWHLERFKYGIERLGLGDPLALAQRFERYVVQALNEVTKSAHLSSAVIKVILTRGLGGRGYTPPEEADCTFIVQVFEAPVYPGAYYDQGIPLHLCQHTLSYQPALAGIKHLNRLDQVLASRELQDAPEGVMLDHLGNIIEGTKSNILIFEGQKVVTPLLEGCGIQGTLRRYLIDNQSDIGIDLVESEITLERFRAASGIAVINSVFGLWPVAEFSGKHYARHEKCGIIQDHLKSSLYY